MHATFWPEREQGSNRRRNLVSDESGPRFAWHTYQKLAPKMELIYGGGFWNVCRGYNHVLSGSSESLCATFILCHKFNTTKSTTSCTVLFNAAYFSRINVAQALSKVRKSCDCFSRFFCRPVALSLMSRPWYTLKQNIFNSYWNYI